MSVAAGVGESIEFGGVGESIKFGAVGESIEFGVGADNEGDRLGTVAGGGGVLDPPPLHTLSAGTERQSKATAAKRTCIKGSNTSEKSEALLIVSELLRNGLGCIEGLAKCF